MMHNTPLSQLAILCRASFDEMVDGEPEPWRESVRKWEAKRAELARQLPEHAIALQSTFEELHDAEITKLSFDDGELTINFETSAQALIFCGVVALEIEPPNEELPLAFLYGEVQECDDGYFIHILCDIVDIYLRCGDFRFVHL